MMEYQLPLLTAVKRFDNQMSIVDGQQRLKSILTFLFEGYPLSHDIPSVNEQEVAGYFFSELPSYLQNIILNYEDN